MFALYKSYDFFNIVQSKNIYTYIILLPATATSRVGIQTSKYIPIVSAQIIVFTIESLENA